MKTTNLSTLKREKETIENFGYLSDCWIGKYTPRGSDKIYYQLRTRKSFSDGTKTKHIRKAELTEYQTLVENGRRLKKLEREITKLEKKKLSSREVLNSSASDEHYTPTGYVELARSVMGSIDLDPASNATAQQWIKADNYFTQAVNGLEQPWRGRLWLNPPYGKYVTLWTDKAHISYTNGDISEAILLVRPAPASAWFMQLTAHYPKCETFRRIRFIDKDGNEGKVVHRTGMSFSI